MAGSETIATPIINTWSTFIGGYYSTRGGEFCEHDEYVSSVLQICWFLSRLLRHPQAFQAHWSHAPAWNSSFIKLCNAGLDLLASEPHGVATREQDSDSLWFFVNSKARSPLDEVDASWWELFLQRSQSALVERAWSLKLSCPKVKMGAILLLSVSDASRSKSTWFSSHLLTLISWEERFNKGGHWWSFSVRTRSPI